MAEYNLGRIGMVCQGSWAAATAYEALDVVGHRGGSFLCREACTGIEPGVTEDWEDYWTLVSDGVRTIAMSRDGTTGNVIVRVTMTGGTVHRFELAPV